MTELVVCRAPGDELAEFGGLLLSRAPGTVDVVAVFGHSRRPEHGDGERILRAACSAAGIREARLLPFAHLEKDPVEPALIADSLGTLEGYERIYTHSVQDTRALCSRTAAAVGLVSPAVWSSAAGGMVDEIIRNDESHFALRLKLLSEHYPDLLAEDVIKARHLRDTSLFQRQSGPNLYRYFRGYVDWHVGDFDYQRPWELEESVYERDRHAAELKVLDQFPWERIVEVGACEGAFTEKLCAAFPGRKVIAVEPDPFFFESLRRRLEGRAELHRGDAEAAGQIPCDVLFMSSAIYYMWRMPYGMLRNARHVVVSHARRYHRGNLDQLFLAQGFESVHQSVVPPRIEAMEGMLEVKYGTEIRVWKRR